jgi:hypothetical protein
MKLGNWLVTAVMVLAAPPAWAVTGSGTVEIRFTSFFGPYGLTSPTFNQTGTVNGVTPTTLGGNSSSGFGDLSYVNGLVGATVSGGTFPLTGAPTTTVSLVDSPDFYDPDFENIFTWTPASFTNVAVGSMFRLGTLTFKNGSWYGAGATPGQNVPTRLGFRVNTFSSSGGIFNQQRSLTLIHTVNAPANNDTSTLAGQQAAADWVTIFDQENNVTLNSFRVYDRNQTPSGFTNIGSVDLMGRFGSLEIIGFANPTGGFITEGDLPLPTVPLPGGGGGGGGGGGVVPEPGTWAMLIAGFGLVGAAARRRRRQSVAG